MNIFFPLCIRLFEYFFLKCFCPSLVLLIIVFPRDMVASSSSSSFSKRLKGQPISWPHKRIGGHSEIRDVPVFAWKDLLWKYIFKREKKLRWGFFKAINFTKMHYKWCFPLDGYFRAMPWKLSYLTKKVFFLSLFHIKIRFLISIIKNHDNKLF